MLYRRFGKTELAMPVLTCGGMRFQEKWSDLSIAEVSAACQANVEAIVHRAMELGINHFETARGYGSSEVQLGCVLPKLPREKIIVQTKVGPADDSRKFVETFEKSLRCLQLDYVDLLAIHGINDDQSMDWSLRPEGCLQAARKLQSQGKCRFVGFSTHGPLRQIQQTIRHQDDGGFDFVNLHWYYIFQRNWPAVELATQRDMGVFIISPSDKGGKLYDPPARLTELCQPLHPIVFNDLFCLSHPQVHTLSIGAARPSDFDLHAQAVPLVERAGQVLAPIVQRLEQAMRQATGSSSPEALLWELPDFEHTPGQVNLPIILWLRNLAVGWGMIEYGKMRYNLLGNGGNWFPGLNVAKLREVGWEKIAPLVADSPLANQLPRLLEETHDLLAAAEVKRLSQSD